jgi:FG-GAP repeat
VVLASSQIIQIGSDIDGEAADDQFGRSVSMSADGAAFVVGAIGNRGNGTGGFTGHVRAYKFDSTINTYAQVGLDIDGEAASDEFGTSVSMSADGSTFVVGARLNTGRNGTDSGHVRVYKLNSTTNTYVQVGLDIDGEAPFDLFGRSVSMSADGSTFVVGATGNDGINGRGSGHVRVYEFNSTINTYTQLGLDIDGEAAADQFGTSVSISADGTTFVVGATANDGINGTRSGSGHVRVYKFDSTINTYAQVGLDIDGRTAGDLLGTSVSMSGDGTTFVVGAPDNGAAGSDSGHIRIYKFNSTINTYVQFGLDIRGEAAGDQFGTSVSMSADGTIFVVGARSNKGSGTASFSGQVRVFKLNSTINKYAQVGLDIDGEAAVDRFGTSVSISADGTTFIVGAPFNNGVNGSNSGHVRVYSTGVIRPTNTPTKSPTKQPTKKPTKSPTKVPTKSPTKSPTTQPTQIRTRLPTKTPTKQPTKVPTTTPTKQPTQILTKSPTTQPINAPTTNCDVSWKLFNSHTDSLVVNLTNDTIVTTPPPCRRTNIEAVVPCGDWNDEVTIELFRNGHRVHRRVEWVAPYFLFGNNGSNVFDGRIKPGTYHIRANVNDVFTPFTTFTLQGPKCQ